MTLSRSSFAGTSLRAALSLVAAWVLFSALQSMVACCEPSGGLFNGLIASAVAANLPSHDAGAQDDCCDTPAQPCPMAMDEMPPLALPSACLLAQHHSPDPATPTALKLFRLPASLDSHRRARVPIAQAPPDSILLRLQRFLI